MNLEQLKAKLEQARTEAETFKKTRIEEIRLKSQIDILTNNVIQEAKAVMESKQEVIDELTVRIEAARQNVLDMNIYSNATKRQIEYNTYGIQGHGKLFELITGMVSGMIYTREDARTEIIATLGISYSLAQSLIDSFVVRPRYDIIQDSIDLGTKGDMATFLSLMPLLATEMNLPAITFTNIPTQELFDTIYERAMLKAESDHQERIAAEQQWEENSNRALQIDLAS